MNKFDYDMVPGEYPWKIQVTEWVRGKLVTFKTGKGVEVLPEVIRPPGFGEVSPDVDVPDAVGPGGLIDDDPTDSEKPNNNTPKDGNPENGVDDTDEDEDEKEIEITSFKTEP